VSRATQGQAIATLAAMRLPTLIALLASATLLTGCATRASYHQVVDQYGLEIKLRSEKPFFGKPVEKGYDQPAIISVPRLEAILSGIEIDTRLSGKSVLRERRTAIRRELVARIAEGLAVAFAEANPDEQVVVLAIRKQRQKGIFDRKYLTSFLTWIEDNQLYVELSRVEWKWDPKSKTDKLPQPEPGKVAMPFEVVTDDVYLAAGRQTVKVDWRSEAFGPLPMVEETGTPVEDGAGAATTSGTPAGTGTAASDGRDRSKTSDPLGGLDAADLRALADLEEAHQSGAIDEAEYQSRRNEILGTTVGTKDGTNAGATED
jgi:hypothetical protein